MLVVVTMEPIVIAASLAQIIMPGPPDSELQAGADGADDHSAWASAADLLHAANALDAGDGVAVAALHREPRLQAPFDIADDRLVVPRSARVRRQLENVEGLVAAAPGARRFARAEHLADARSKRQRTAGAEAHALAGQLVPAQVPRNMKLMIPTTIKLDSGSGGRDLLPFMEVARRLACSMLASFDAATSGIHNKLYQHFLRAGSRPVLSGVAIGLMAGVDRRQATVFYKRYACALVHLDRVARLQMERRIAQACEGGLLLYVDHHRGDETPLKVRCASVVVSQPSAPSEACAAVAQQHAALTGLQDVFQVMPTKDTATFSRKLLQSESKFGMLVKQPASDRLLAIVGSTVNWLQHLDRCTAEVLKGAGEETVSLSDVPKRFAMRVRLCTEDQHGANERSERAVVQERSEESPWLRLHLHCEVHICATVHTRVMSLVEGCVSGQVNFALALNFGTNMHTWRQELRAVIRERLVIKRGPPPPSCLPYKQQLLRLCLIGSTRRLEKLLAMYMLPNGNWANMAQVEVYVPVGAACNLNSIADNLSAGLVQVTASSNYTIFPRSRWTKADRAMSEIALLQGCHGLASATFPRFVKRVSGKRLAPLAGQCPAPGEQALPQPLLAQGGADDDDGDDDDNEGGLGDRGDSPWEPAVAAGVGPSSASEGPGATAESKSPEDNERHRRKAGQWLASQPLAEILITRLVQEPLRQYLSAQLVMASESWEQAQQVAEAKAMAAHQASSQWLSRSFRLLEVARGTLDARFLEQTSMLFFRPQCIQRLLPSDFQTLGARSLAFRMLSTSRCNIQQNLVKRHRSFPMRFFCLMQFEDVEDRLAKVPACMLDPFTVSFIQHHRDEGQPLHGAVARGRCLLILRLAEVDISRIECGHASLRRRMHTRSTQTHGLDLELLSAEHVMDKVRHRRRCAQWFDHGASASASAASAASLVGQPGGRQVAAVGDRAAGAGAGGSDESSSHKACGGGGGAWRAFVRKESIGKKGGLQSSAELAAKYRQLSDEEREELARDGKLATETRRALGHDKKGSSFGLVTRQVQRTAAKRARVAFAQQLALRDPDDVGTDVVALDRIAHGAVGAANSGASSLACAVQRARHVERASGALARQRDRDDAALVQTWCREHGSAYLHSLVEQAPLLAEVCQEVAALPDRMSNVLQFNPDCKLAAGMLQWSSSNPHRTNVGPTLDQDWAAKHRPIMHAQQPPIGPAPKRRKVPYCYEAGVCLCSASGRDHWKFRNTFLREMKLVFRRGSSTMQLLVAKHAVVQLHGRKQAAMCPWEGAARQLEGLSPGEVSETRWWHIGAHTFKPYHSSFHPLAAAAQGTHAGVCENEVHLEACVVEINGGIIVDDRCLVSGLRVEPATLCKSSCSRMPTSNK